MLLANIIFSLFIIPTVYGLGFEVGVGVGKGVGAGVGDFVGFGVGEGDFVGFGVDVGITPEPTITQVVAYAGNAAPRSTLTSAL